MQGHGPQTVAKAAPPLFSLRVALLFCAPMLVNGIGLPYFPVFLDYLKMSDGEIGIILAMPYIMRVFGTSLGTFAADRAKDRANVLIWSSVLSLATALGLYFTHSFWAVLIVYSLQGLFYAPYVPIAEAILISGVRRWGYDYGFLRLWGSVAFIGANLVGGWLFGMFGGVMVMPAMAGFFTLTIVMALWAPRIGRARPISIAIGDRIPSGASPFMKGDFICMIVGAALVQGSHGLLFSFGSIYWSAHGFSGSEISLFWTAGVVAEIVMFYLSRRYLSRFSLWALVLASSIFAVVRWSIFHLNYGFWFYLVLQSMHAFTFASCHIGIQRFLISRVDEKDEASAQGYYTTFTVLFTAITTLASGYIYNRLNVGGFYVMTAVAALGSVLVLAAYLAQPQSARSGGNTSESR